MHFLNMSSVDDVPDPVLLEKVTNIGRRTWQVPERGCRDTNGKQVVWTNKEAECFYDRKKTESWRENWTN